MVIYIGADHRGFKMKAELTTFLKTKGYQVVDVGAKNYNENDDYPDFARDVALNVIENYENARGILICSSGVGVNVVANKFERIRCALVTNSNQAYDSRNDDDCNVLALPVDYINNETAKTITLTWIETPFSNEERHKRRIDKINFIEGIVSRPVNKDSFSQ